MKISKKVLIPVFATAMGLSVIGGISGAVAWYQYNTKVTASFMGVTSADGGVLQVSDDNGSTWKRDIDFGSATSKLHPVTYGALASNAALPSAISSFDLPLFLKAKAKETSFEPFVIEYV